MRPAGGSLYSVRCKISHRPAYRTAEPVFFRCEACGAVTVMHVSANGGAGQFSPLCCGAHQRQLPVCQDARLQAEHQIEFVIFGGFERNAVWIGIDGGAHPMGKEHRIEWLYLRTYQGGQLKHLPLGGRTCAHFALADEDAYVYCDREICKMGHEHCQFECKRENIVYAYCTKHGLMRLSLSGIEKQVFRGDATIPEHHTDL